MPAPKAMNEIENVNAGTIGSSAWLAVVFLACCLILGLALGLFIGRWRMSRTAKLAPGGSDVDHVSELLEGLKLLLVQLLAVSRIRQRLLLLKLQLLVQKALLKLELLPQQLFLKWVRDAWCQPHAKESAEHGGANSGKEKLVCHKRVVTTANRYSAKRGFGLARLGLA